MTMLACSRQEVIASQTLAASVNTNPVVVRRLLMALRRAGLIETFSGKNGGTRLRITPDRVSLAEIYDAVEPRRVISVNDRKALRQCHVSCNMKRIMSTVARGTEEAVRRHLSRITLAEVVHNVGNSGRDVALRHRRTYILR